MPYDPPPVLGGLAVADLIALAEGERLPPLAQWLAAGPREGESHIRIAANGQWFHEGGLITRPAMVRAFARLIWRDDTGQHWLVAPGEKLRLAVEDAALIAVDMVVREDLALGPLLAFRLNTDETVIAGPAHRLVARGTAEVPALYLAVRHGAEARLNRSTYGQLIEHALDTAPADDLAVVSQGERFVLVPQ